MVSGPGAADYVNATLTNDLRKIGHGQAQYTLCCDAETGGIVDDLIAYLHTDERVLLVPNAANTAEVVRRLVESAPEGVTVTDHHDDYAVLAVQGTKSDEVLDAVGLPTGHDYMSFVEAQLPGGDDGVGVVVCRTGYTGERGYELIAANDVAVTLWDALLACRCRPRHAALRPRRPGHAAHGDGLPAARPGHLARRDPQPGPARLGRRAGTRTSSGAATRCCARRRPVPTGSCAASSPPAAAIPRPHMGVSLTHDFMVGEVTSGTFSPTLKKGVGLALVSSQVAPDAEVGVDVRGRREIFQITKPPFVDPSTREQ